MAFATHPFENEELDGVFQSPFEVFEFGDHALFFEGVFYDELRPRYSLRG